MAVEFLLAERGAITTRARALCQHLKANEVWASRTVKDLVAGSRFRFNERGSYSLKGVSGDWPLFAVEL